MQADFHPRAYGAARLLTCGMLVGIAGCGVAGLPAAGDSQSGLVLGSGVIEARINNAFETAEPVPVSDQDYFIYGTIDEVDDVDVFSLGPVLPGDRVLVDMVTDDDLLGDIALFDGAGTSLLINDYRNSYLGRFGPFVDVVIQHASPDAYVAVCGTPGTYSTGEYSLAIRVVPEQPMPDANPDVVLLDFAGAQDVAFSSRQPVDVPTFDAADIDPAYKGQTEEMMALIVELVRADFAAYNVDIRSTSEGYYDDGVATRVYFGAYDPGLLGVAQGVDEYNTLQAQEAIVFTDTFAAFMSLDPTVEEMAQAIANVTSHEIGHLLGLVHTANPAEIMDVTATLNELMLDQTFGRSWIHPDVFPIGSQDSAALIADATGLNPVGLFLPASKVASTQRDRLKYRDTLKRGDLVFGTCSHGGCSSR